MNDKHYPAGSNKGGQFAPKGTTSSIPYIPKITNSGKKRYFYEDLPEETKIAIESEYESKHSDIITQLDYLYDNFNTIKKNDDARKMLRMKLINDEINDQLKQGPKRKERKATLVLGLPGSGKSTITNPLIKQMGAFNIDADNFKQRIPEFREDKRMVSAVHQESVELSNKMLSELTNNGYNMVAGKVGGNYESVEPLIDLWSQNGYEIEVILVDVPFDTAIDRTIGRFDRGETDRLIPFWTTKTADKHIFETFDKILEQKNVIGGKIYSNDVNLGQAPILLHKF